ncbi:MAG: hypothetical protein ABW068_11060, partial [Candidatus Thiodiazotropha sp.]
RLRHVGFPVSPRDYRGLPAFASLSLAGSDGCHTTSAWLPVSTYRHVSAYYPGDHGVRLTCSSCHTSNSEVVPWPSPTYARTCAGCHANDYRPGVDRHNGLSNDADCGRCHRVSSREW